MTQSHDDYVTEQELYKAKARLLQPEGIQLDLIYTIYAEHWTAVQASLRLLQKPGISREDVIAEEEFVTEYLRDLASWDYLLSRARLYQNWYSTFSEVFPESDQRWQLLKDALAEAES